LQCYYNVEKNLHAPYLISRYYLAVEYNVLAVSFLKQNCPATYYCPQLCCHGGAGREMCVPWMLPWGLPPALWTCLAPQSLTSSRGRGIKTIQEALHSSWADAGETFCDLQSQWHGLSWAGCSERTRDPAHGTLEHEMWQTEHCQLFMAWRLLDEDAALLGWWVQCYGSRLGRLTVLQLGLLVSHTSRLEAERGWAEQSHAVRGVPQRWRDTARWESCPPPLLGMATANRGSKGTAIWNSHKHFSVMKSTVGGNYFSCWCNRS